MMALLGGTALFLMGSGNSRGNGIEQNKEQARAMAAAKAALIAYSVNYVDHYGHNIRGGVGRLPCPSRTRHGSPGLSCSGNSIGYLPTVWNRSGKRIEIDYLERFLGRDFWYAVSSEHRYNPSFNQLNSTSTDQLLAVDAIDDIVAVLIAPGNPVNQQDRATIPVSVVNYLEAENADGDTVFSGHAGNDQVLPIRRSEIMPLIERRVLGYARDWLIEYKREFGFYPYAAMFGDESGDCQSGLLSGALAMQQGACVELAFGEFSSAVVPRSRLLNEIWFATSDWPSFIYYRVDEHCVGGAAPGLCDGVNDPPHALTVEGNPVEVLLVSAGAPIVTIPSGSMQERSNDPGALVHYLDSESLLDGDSAYSFPRLSELSNDQFLVIE
ncbi:hypothetical protein AB833_25680 [Chromatiales bacterium (ex Bugula neritina AB1)]|nr:hypothetical protein AB833_25680 [Chromatiales bacterium (ex Bugula neritina AB1)]